MLADATSATPSALVLEVDPRFLSDGLDHASVIVCGRRTIRRLGRHRGPWRRRPRKDFPDRDFFFPRRLTATVASGPAPR
jgi:hypothetical protein